MTHLFGIFQQNHHYFSGLPQSRQCKEKESVECGTVPVAAFACHHSHWCLLYEFVWVWLFLTHKVIAFIPQFAVSTVSPVFHVRKLKLVFCLFSAACTRYTFLFLALSFWLNSDSKLVSRNQTHQINTIITITTNWTCYCEDGTFDKRKRKKSFANVGCCRHYAWWSNIIFAFCWSWISIFIVSLCLPLYPPIALTFSRGLCFLWPKDVRTLAHVKYYHFECILFILFYHWINFNIRLGWFLMPLTPLWRFEQPGLYVQSSSSAHSFPNTLTFAKMSTECCALHFVFHSFSSFSCRLSNQNRRNASEWHETTFECTNFPNGKIKCFDLTDSIINTEIKSEQKRISTC